MGVFRKQRFARQPQHPVRLDKASTVRLALNGAAPELKTNVGSKAVGPWGVGLFSAVDNAFQFPRDLALQNADVVTVQMLLFAPVAPSGSGSSKLFGTRGTASGDGNRRGWEVGIDGGSAVDAQLQVIDSGGSRSSTSVGTGYTGADVTAKPLWATFQIVRTPGASTDLSVWLKTSNLPETSATASVAVPFADDTTLLNFPEICGQYAGSSTQSDYQVLACFARIGAITQSQRQAFYARPWQAFIDEERLPWLAEAAAGGGSSGTLATQNAADTSSSAGTTTVVGSLARSNAADTSVAAGSPIVAGSLARSNAADTASASGAVGASITGTLATTNANDTSTASGSPVVAGSLARSNANDTSAATGSTTVRGTVAHANANDTVVASGIAGAVTGTVSYTNEADRATASGSGGLAVVSSSSGGFFEVPQVKRRRTVKEERELLGIIPREAKQIIQAVARASVVADKTDEQASQQLTKRLAQQDIEAKARYTEFMQRERDRILSRDIDRALRIKQRQAELDDDEEASIQFLLM